MTKFHELPEKPSYIVFEVGFELALSEEYN